MVLCELRGNTLPVWSKVLCHGSSSDPLPKKLGQLFTLLRLVSSKACMQHVTQIETLPRAGNLACTVLTRTGACTPTGCYNILYTDNYSTCTYLQTGFICT